ncbi:hypothetical protein D6C97_06122 [Aureobasidium pullulans]|nr:hypothetical protein D6C97_06122 [Aureobasidium pullulans]
MDYLPPWTKELLNSGGSPTIDSFEAFRWLDARAPGVYACLAMKKDKSGRIIAVRMKVGCAWSFEGGLKARQRTHLNDEQSKKEASQNSPFHMSIQSTDPDQEDLELKWLTLAVGMPYIRETQADEYLAAWYYQLEAMLASALGSLDEKGNDYRFRGMQWWPFDSAGTTEAWKRADHHCSIRDIWAKRPTMRTEDEIDEREAAARVVETTRSRETCTSVHTPDARGSREGVVSGQAKLLKVTMPGTTGMSQAGKGFKTLQTLERHLTRYYQLEPPRVLNVSSLATSRDRDYGHPA